MKTLLVFLSTLLNIRFRNGTSLHSVIRDRYGQPTVQVVRRLENTTIHLEDTIQQSKFLHQCKTYNLTPKFLNFKLFNSRLHTSEDYIAYQRKLLDNEIKFKSKTVTKFQSNIALLKDELRSKVTWLLVCTIVCVEMYTVMSGNVSQTMP